MFISTDLGIGIAVSGLLGSTVRISSHSNELSITQKEQVTNSNRLILFDLPQINDHGRIGVIFRHI